MGYPSSGSCGGGRKNAAAIATAWGAVMKQTASDYPGAKLVSPATACLPPGEKSPRTGDVDSIAWFREFFGNCSLLYGSRGCQTAHMAVHYYGCNATEAMAYLQQHHDAFGLPLWLTEFSCGHDPVVEHHARYLKELLPLLDASPIVFRYAWMSARARGSGSERALLVPGEPRLTPLGRLYNTV